jgi:hypothetical protein
MILIDLEKHKDSTRMKRYMKTALLYTILGERRACSGICLPDTRNFYAAFSKMIL